MKYIEYKLSEIDIISILNCICFSLNAIQWNDCNMHNRKLAERYFNFETGEYANQLDNLIRLRDIINLQTKRYIIV